MVYLQQRSISTGDEHVLPGEAAALDVVHRVDVRFCSSYVIRSMKELPEESQPPFIDPFKRAQTANYVWTFA